MHGNLQREEYVVRQLQSILDQLSPDDEVIVVDDCSTDGTVEAVRALNDPRVAVHVNDRNRREVYSFSRAISLARHQFIFLSDQDDIWLPGRVALMTEALQTALLATTNFDWIDQDERPLQISHDGVLPEDSAAISRILQIFSSVKPHISAAQWRSGASSYRYSCRFPTTSSCTTGGLRWPATSLDPTFT